MDLSPEVADFAKWLLNQGIATAVVAFFLLDLRGVLRTLADQQRQILDLLSDAPHAARGGTPSPA